MFPTMCMKPAWRRKLISSGMPACRNGSAGTKPNLSNAAPSVPLTKRIRKSAQQTAVRPQVMTGRPSTRAEVRFDGAVVSTGMPINIGTHCHADSGAVAPSCCSARSAMRRTSSLASSSLACGERSSSESSRRTPRRTSRGNCQASPGSSQIAMHGLQTSSARVDPPVSSGVSVTSAISPAQCGHALPRPASSLRARAHTR